MQQTCNICGGTEFGVKGSRPTARCLSCDSLERTRLLWMYMESLEFTPEMKVLHLAPDPCIYGALSAKITPGSYVTADFNPHLYKSFAPSTIEIDLTDLGDWPSNEYDLILHCHVLEHIPCNIAYPIYHLNRMMTEHGRHMFIVPFMSGKWEESFRDIGDEARTERYGQFDHVRSFGRDDAMTHLGSVVPIEMEFDAIAEFGEERLKAANVPLNMARGLTTSTVINIGRDDMFKRRMVS